MFAGLIQYTLLTMPAIFAHALRTNGIKEMSHGSSGEKQVISFFSNTRNRSRFCLFLNTGSEQLFFLYLRR